MMVRQRHYIALAGMALLTGVLLKLPNGAVTRMKVSISGVFLPLFGAAGSTGHAVDTATAALTSKGQLSRQIAELQAQNRDLRIQSMQWNAVSQENVRLRQHLGISQQRTGWNLKLARVVARDPANWWRSLKIDR